MQRPNEALTRDYKIFNTISTFILTQKQKAFLFLFPKADSLVEVFINIKELEKRHSSSWSS